MQYRDLNKPMLDFFRHNITDIIKPEEKPRKKYKIIIKNEDGSKSKWIHVYASDFGFVDASGSFYHRNKVVRRVML